MIRRLVLGGLLVLVAGGCATKADVNSLENRMLSEMQELRAEQQVLLERLGMAFDTLTQQERRQLATRGEMQRQFDRIGELLGQLLEMTSQTNVLVSELREARVGVRPSPGAEPPNEAERPEAESRADEARMFYEAAQQQFRRGAYGTAREGFEDFLENYPNHELAPDAQFFLGESYAEADDRRRAMEEYRRVVELYPDSRRAPTALYKMGMIERERGNTSEARQLFQRVELGYPNSPEAELARDQLRRLRQ